MQADLVIVGGGPAGLAVAIEAASRGLSAVVLERSGGALDKACGEGLLSAGVRWLCEKGVLPLLPAGESRAFGAIRYVQEDGRVAQAELPAPGGLCVRRPALTWALQLRAQSLGVELWTHCKVFATRRETSRVTVRTSRGACEGALLVGADGLHSRVRWEAGLSGRPSSKLRYGARRHFRLRPWADAVEVHFAAGAEAYVSPSGPERVGVALLWEPEGAQPFSFEQLLGRFPWLYERLSGAEALSPVAGAGPLSQRARAVVSHRLALVGDAAGYVDAVTGEGVSIALQSAAVLGRLLPQVLAQGASTHSLLPYAQQHAALYGRYAVLTRAVVALAGRHRLRRAVVDGLIARPKALSRLLEWAAGGGY